MLEPTQKNGVSRRRRRWRLVAVVVLAASAAAYVSLCCIPPASFRATKEPREGRVMNSRVAVVYSQKYQIDLGGAEKLHSFDIRKYAKIYLALNTDGFVRPEDVFVPEPVSLADLLRVHTPQYLASLRDPAAVARYLEAPIVGAMPALLLDSTVLQPFRYATGGTILASRLALRYGIAINIGGGYHHAKPDSGGGFCIYADMPIAIRVLQAEGLIRRVLVVDLDVHQGNGTAACLAGDKSVFIFDMHQGNLYPYPKEKCDLDVELDAGTGDETYLAILARYLPGLLDRVRPDLVFLQAGCDVLAGDPLAGLALTPQGIVRRDAFVIDACAGRKIPLVMVTGGGYSPEAWQVQYQSIRRTIETYGLAGERPYPPRGPTTKEQLYVK